VSDRREVIPAQDLGVALFGITFDESTHASLFQDLEQFDISPRFKSSDKDLTLYLILMPQLSMQTRPEIRNLRIELMFLTFAWIDYLLMRSQVIRELHQDNCVEVLTYYTHCFKNLIEPTGRSEEFLAELERRLRAYNEDLDHIFHEGEKRNKFKLEESFLTFCGQASGLPDLRLYLTLQQHFTNLLTSLSNFMLSYRIV
jgi:hypothetical protein